MRLAYFIVGSALAALPFLAADYVPATDLPQHLAQIRMWRELWGLDPHTMELSSLVARPLGANTLVYWPMLALWQLLSVRWVGKLTVWLLVQSSVAALHVLAWRRERDPAHALLAGMLLFSLPLYWGLLNYLSGLPIFLLTCEHALRESSAPLRARDIAVRLLLLLALCWAHVFWLACAALVVLLRAWLKRDAGYALRWGACFVPFAAAAAAWLPSLARARRASGVELGVVYQASIAGRLSWNWLCSTCFGGVRGPLEPLALLGLAAYATVVCVRGRSSRRQGYDPMLLAVGASLLVFALVAPDKVLNTILFNGRVLSCSGMLLLLALPASQARWTKAAALLLAAGFAVVTTLAWSVHAELELSGLRESLASVTGPRSVLGLDYRADASILRGRPFLQDFAYFQAEHGGELSFSFAEHQSGIVALARPRTLRWTQGLEWYPQRLQPRDVDAFDCVLVNGTDDDHSRFSERFGLRSPVAQGYFRVYCHAQSEPLTSGSTRDR